MANKKVLHFIGYDGERAVNTTMTQQQIDQLKALRCDLATDDGETITWADLDNSDEPRTLFRFILGDHKLRVDERTRMANQSPFGVATIVNGACVRFEFYEGYHTLKKTHDLRSKELQGVELEDSVATNVQIACGMGAGPATGPVACVEGRSQSACGGRVHRRT
jgi:hypothetical protein